MSREWQPGDVAMVTNRYGVDNVGICSVSPSGRLWRFGVTDGTEDVEADARPLVVIDPEDREQVERLARGYVAVFNIDKVNMVAIADAIQQALRAFADPEPPKPDEPMGLGAVAEQHGCRWTHVGNGRWVQCLSDGRVSNGRNWEDFTSVAVLSEGVAL